MPRRASLVLLVLASCLPACGKSRDADRGPARAAPADVVFEDSAIGLHLELPGTWAGRFRAVRDTVTTIGAERVWLFLYPPRDAGIAPQALMAVAVYDSIVWRRVSSEEGPPPGEELARAGARVAVIGWPQSNPFPPGPDSAAFDSLVIPRGEMPRRLTLR